MYDFVFSGALVNSFVFRLAEEKYTDRRKRKKQNEAQKWLLMLEISRMYVVALKRKLVFEVLCVCFFSFVPFSLPLHHIFSLIEMGMEHETVQKHLLRMIILIPIIQRVEQSIRSRIC